MGKRVSVSFSFSVASRRRRKIDKWRLYSSIAHRMRERRGNPDIGLSAGKKHKNLQIISKTVEKIDKIEKMVFFPKVNH